MIDLHLLRLRYEILNISLEDLAKEIDTPLPIVQQEARNNNWTQWWPNSLPINSLDLPIAAPPSGIAVTTDDFDEEGLSPLEDGANNYIKESSVRLRVYNLAKEIHLAHKYASFESALLDKAKALVDSAADPSDVLNLVRSLKDLIGKATSVGLQVSNEDGLPTVIIRDLSGKRA